MGITGSNQVYGEGLHAPDALHVLDGRLRRLQPSFRVLQEDDGLQPDQAKGHWFLGEITQIFPERHTQGLLDRGNFDLRPHGHDPEGDNHAPHLIT
jgi:hypothetical protein